MTGSVIADQALSSVRVCKRQQGHLRQSICQSANLPATLEDLWAAFGGADGANGGNGASWLFVNRKVAPRVSQHKPILILTNMM